MKFKDFIKLMDSEFGIDVQADIARELDVTPQTLNNWKIRDNVPYKYVKKAKSLLDQEKVGESKFYYPPNYDNLNSNEDSILKYIKVLFSDLREYLKFSVTVFILFILSAFINYKYFSVPVYESTTSLVSSTSQDNLSAIMGNLTSTLGVSKGSKDNALNSNEMIPEVLLSRNLALSILNESFDSEIHGRNKKLINILSYNKDLSNYALSRDDTTNLISKFLRNNIKIIKTKNNNVVKFAVYFYEPVLTLKIANTVSSQLHQFYGRNKKIKNLSKKTFINERSSELLKQLTIAEDKLKNFRQNNRNIFSSPELTLEQARLMRNVEVQSQLYITLLSQYEMVSIDENENLLFFEILDPPFVPTKKIKPIFIEILMKYIFVGISFIIACVYIHNGRIKNFISENINFKTS